MTRQYIASLATDFGIWEIGSPTSGPGGAHTGTNCAATVLGGNYLDDRTARLESPAFVVPVASELPRLRFWHWWRFNCYDFGRVEISRDNGVNWGALSGEFSADSSGRWSRGWFDLTAYAGQTVRLGFYFQSQSGPNCEGWDPEVAPGWYVDDLLVETGPLPLRTLPESFEEGSAGWWMRYIGGTATDYGIWEVGVPTSGPGAAHGGTNCAATVLSGNYPDDRSARLISGPFQVPAADLYPRLRFWHWWRFNCYDWGQVQISSDNGANWAGLSDRFTADSTGRWTHPLFDLANFAGQTVWLGFHFQSESGPNCEGWNPEVAPGWYVDDVVIEVDCLTAVPREIVGPEGRLATFAAKACRPDYVFGLGPGAPEGARIDSQLGIFSWVPADCQGPSTNQITVTVTDPGNPTLQPLDYAVVTVVVTEVNEPPVIGAVAPLLLEANVPFSLNASNFVYDPDRPAQTLTYSLDACSPASAKMDSATGRLDWMPTAAEAAQTNTICLRVTDDAGLSATATILAGPFPPDRPPEISQFRLVGTSLELAVENARANDTLVIEAASELAEGPVPTVWTELGSVRWQSNPVRFENVYSANTPGRFFRLKLAR